MIVTAEANASNLTSSVDHEITDDILEETFEKCLEYFAASDKCIHFFEVGLLQSLEHDFLGVSADGIAMVMIPGTSYASLPPVMVIVEIKTRVGIDTIANAVAAMNMHGAIVACEYDDDIFKKCVPSGNRAQFIHQVLVTGLEWGVFITAKVEDIEGSIIQLVYEHFSEEQKNIYKSTLLCLAKPLVLVGWLCRQRSLSSLDDS